MEQEAKRYRESALSCVKNYVLCLLYIHTQFSVCLLLKPIKLLHNFSTRASYTPMNTTLGINEWTWIASSFGVSFILCIVICAAFHFGRTGTIKSSSDIFPSMEKNSNISLGLHVSKFNIGHLPCLNLKPWRLICDKQENACCISYIQYTLFLH